LDVEIKTQEGAPENEVSNEILSNFDEALHNIVRMLFENNIEFNTEYDFDLIESDIIIASAELGTHTKKIVVNPFDEESKQTFIKNGYKVYSPDNFKLED
jgi:DEAD/DEAH box helicase domain-containing protein